MPWQRLILDSTRAAADQLSDQLSALGALAVSLEDSADEPLFDTRISHPDTAEALWAHTTVVALFDEHVELALIISALENAIAPEPLPTYRFEIMQDQKWERVWLDRFKPIHIHNRLWISPTGHTVPDPEAITVLIDPGLAFGTGTHPTTHLCLEWLAHQNLLGKTVVDYGCGSGILAIAALKLGAARALATDNDPQALIVSRDNAGLNGVADKLECFLPEDMPDIAADFVVANILAEPLVSLATVIGRHAAADGHLALSGLLCEQAMDVQKYYDEHFDLALTSREDWGLLAGIRRTPINRIPA